MRGFLAISRQFCVGCVNCLLARPAYGHLRGNTCVMQSGRKRYLIDIIIETICSCRDDPGENVQLQVLKALLTVVSSNTCRTHGESLLLAVRACYHIYLVSKNPVNRSTAKASLTQILSIVFQRMETEQSRADGQAPPAEEPQPSLPLAVPVLTTVECDPETSLSPGPATPPRSSLGDGVVDSNPSSKPAGGDASTVATTADSAAVPEATNSSDQPFLGVEGSAGPAAGAGVGPAATAGVAAVTPGAPPVTPATMEPEGYGGMSSLGGFTSAAHRDAFLLFRALCKLSMKGDDEDTETHEAIPDAVALQSKILSLELLLLVLERSGPAFRSGARFTEVIRKASAAKSCVFCGGRRADPASTTFVCCTPRCRHFASLF